MKKYEVTLKDKHGNTHTVTVYSNSIADVISTDLDSTYGDDYTEILCVDRA